MPSSQFSTRKNEKKGSTSAFSLTKKHLKTMESARKNMPSGKKLTLLARKAFSSKSSRKNTSVQPSGHCVAQLTHPSLASSNLFPAFPSTTRHAGPHARTTGRSNQSGLFPKRHLGANFRSLQSVIDASQFGRLNLIFCLFPFCFERRAGHTRTEQRGP